KAEVAARPDDLDGNVILAELFAETGAGTGFEKHREVVARVNPHDPRLPWLLRRRAASQGPVSAAARHARQGWSLYAAGKPEAALVAIAPVAEKVPACLDLQVLHAHLLTVTGKLEAAATAWFRTARYHPNEDDLWFNLGLALWRLGRKPDAGFALRR